MEKPVICRYHWFLWFQSEQMGLRPQRHRVLTSKPDSCGAPESRSLFRPLHSRIYACSPCMYSPSALDAYIYIYIYIYPLSPYDMHSLYAFLELNVGSGTMGEYLATTQNSV